MNHTGISSQGPKCFGTTKRTSFVDIRDDDIPGPGAHDAARIDKQTPSKWKFAKDTERDTFLQKYPRPNPSPNQYFPNKQPTMTSHPLYSIPQSQVQGPACYKQDQNCRVDYAPNSNINKNQYPNYSFGYFFEHDYSTPYPAPNNYEVKHQIKYRHQFNKTQSFFTSASRPLPYGEEGKNPGIGQYHLHSKDPMYATTHTFGRSQKLLNPKFQGTVPVKHYDISKQMKQHGKGYTMRPYYQGVKNKDFENFPAANHYNPKYIQSRKKIISFTGKRSELYNQDLVKYPNPQKYVTPSQYYQKKKSLSFTRQIRYEFKPLEGPGPAKYNMERRFSSQKGYMGRKIKKLPQFITPAGNDYNPVDHLTKTTPQRVINYDTHRTNFSKSITGEVGPGEYQVATQPRKSLGKMSKSLKFQKNRNRNPGPGFYEIPTTIGKLPKYYCGQKKVTVDGYSTFTLQMNEKSRRKDELAKSKQIQKQKQEQILREKQQEQQKAK